MKQSITLLAAVGLFLQINYSQANDFPSLLVANASMGKEPDSSGTF